LPQPGSALVDAVARRFAPAGYFARYFARGKLRGDPIFFWLLRRGVIPDGARVLDLGCGQGVLLALLVEARAAARAGTWPGEWAPAPKELALRGIELLEAEVARARIALGAEAAVEQGDARDAPLPASDLVLLIDVVHYLEPEAQERLLARIHAALAPDGIFLLRICDAAAGWRALATRAGDAFATLTRHGRLPRVWLRSAAEWQARLAAAGFAATSQAMSEGTPFANVLFCARRESARGGAA